MFLSLGSSMLQPPSENNPYFQHTSGYNATYRKKFWETATHLLYRVVHYMLWAQGWNIVHLPSQRRSRQGQKEFFFDVFNTPTLNLKTWSKIHDNVFIKTPTTRGNVRLWQLTTSEGACDRVETLSDPKRKRSSIWFIFGYTYNFCGKDMLGGQGRLK